MRCIALDVHQRYCEGAELLPGGKIRSFRVATTRDGIEAFARQLGPDVRLVMEATGNALWIYDLISPHAGQVLLANPLRTRTDRRSAYQNRPAGRGNPSAPFGS